MVVLYYYFILLKYKIKTDHKGSDYMNDNGTGVFKNVKKYLVCLDMI